MEQKDEGQKPSTSGKSVVDDDSTSHLSVENRDSVASHVTVSDSSSLVNQGLY